jgi:hypothetical protein
VLAAVVILVVASAAGVVAVMSSAKQTTDPKRPPNTVTVEQGNLWAMVSLDGTLTHRARSDGSPYSAINQAGGTYTKLPDDGDKIDCGDVFYRVDDRPVLLLCGTVPAYRDLHGGDHGKDVRQLNRNLHQLEYDHAAGVDIGPGDRDFTWKTETALEKLEHDKGADATGQLTIDDALFLPESVRISKVTGTLGGSARPGAPVAQGTSDALEVQVALEAYQQGEVMKGAPAQITLPGNRMVKGTVDRLGRVAQTAKEDVAEAATISAYITLDHPGQARGLDQAPVHVDITTKGVENALSVPVIAIVGRSGGGYAVEVVRDGGRRELVTVKLGLFDTAHGRVQVEGDLGDGDHVVVPSL